MNQLIIFVKAPRPGFVKTRLAEAIGPIEACHAYSRLVTTLLDRLQSLDQVELRFAPDNGFPEIEPWLRKGWSANPQGAGDLGKRMETAFLDAFSRGCRQVALIGSDCPEVCAEDIIEAWNHLSEHGLVLGPAHDGGYWLIALREMEPSLFAGITWSTDKVRQETMERAQDLRLHVHLLRKLTDVDTAAEWKKFQENR